jgi:MarR family transcriptional regulator, organic hydroperoxide resistance regulator
VPVLPLDAQLCFSFYNTAMAIGRVYKPILDRLGLTYPQYLVLHALWESDGRTVGGVAERLSLEPSTVTPLVTRLERSGLVRRARDAEDERRVRVWLTERGERLREDCVALGEALVARAGLPLSDLADLHERVNRFRAALQAEG